MPNQYGNRESDLMAPAYTGGVSCRVGVLANLRVAVKLGHGRSTKLQLFSKQLVASAIVRLVPACRHRARNPEQKSADKL